MDYEELKPIETMYNDILFRSRLEARWAVFFDELGIKYSYEDEGYRLPSGYYLPDFLLYDHDIIVEIKPKYPKRIEVEKCLQLSNFKRVILIYGYPWYNEYNIIGFYNGFNYTGIKFCQLSCKSHALCISGDSVVAKLCPPACKINNSLCSCNSAIPDGYRIMSAYSAAKGKRFDDWLKINQMRRMSRRMRDRL